MSSSNSQNEVERLSGEVSEQRERAEKWDTWNIRFLFVAGLAAVLLAVTAVGVSRSNHKLALLTNELDKAKDADLQHSLKDKDDKIAAINKDAESAKRDAEKFKLDIAHANERASKADAAAAEAKLALEKFKLPRKLTPEQQKLIAAKIRAVHGIKFDVAITSLPEAQDFTPMLEDALALGGWTQIDWKGGDIVFTRTPRHIAGIVTVTGVVIQMHKDQVGTLGNPAVALRDALRAEGIEARAEGNAGATNGNPEALHILIGEKPK